MDGKRLIEVRQMLGLKKKAMARLFKISDRSVRRWEDDPDQFPIPVAHAMALELMVRYACPPAVAYKMATGEDFEG